MVSGLCAVRRQRYATTKGGFSIRITGGVTAAALEATLRCLLHPTRRFEPTPRRLDFIQFALIMHYL